MATLPDLSIWFYDRILSGWTDSRVDTQIPAASHTEFTDFGDWLMSRYPMVH